MERDECGNIDTYEEKLVAQNSPRNMQWIINIMLIAFFNGNLCEKIYIKQPQEYRVRESKLSLKQSTRAWKNRKIGVLTADNFRRGEETYAYIRKGCK